MSNLQQFFGGVGGSAGSVPLRGITFFPHDAPVKVRSGTEVYLRSGHGETVEYDPSLQSWVDDNIMFVTTHFTESSETLNLTRGIAVDTDGQGKWMVAGFGPGGGNTLPRLLYSADDGVNFQPATGFTFPAGTGAIISSIRSGGNGVWIITVASSSVHSIWRTTDNGQTWTDVSTALWGGAGVGNVKALETDRAGNWMAISDAATYGRKSSDNGQTWTQFNFPFSNGGKGLRVGGDGVWIAGISTETASGFNSKIAVSSNFGQTWSAEITVSMVDFAWVKDRWVGLLGNDFYFKAGADFTKWNKQFCLTPDFFTDSHNGTTYAQTHLMTVGLDGSLWRPVQGSLYRSPDYGVTWTKTDVDADYVMAGPNKRTVAVHLANSFNAANLKPGIVTGRPAAGIPVSNIASKDSAGDYGNRVVAHVRIK